MLAADLETLLDALLLAEAEPEEALPEPPPAQPANTAMLNRLVAPKKLRRVMFMVVSSFLLSRLRCAFGAGRTECAPTICL